MLLKIEKKEREQVASDSDDEERRNELETKEGKRNIRTYTMVLLGSCSEGGHVICEIIKLSSFQALNADTAIDLFTVLQ